MDHGIRFIGLIPVFIWAPVRVAFSYKSGFTRVRRIFLPHFLDK
jgi:hypothetical protein